MQDTDSTSRPKTTRKSVKTDSTEVPSAASDAATKDETADHEKAKLQIRSMKQRLDHRKQAARWIFWFPAIHLAVNFALIIAQFCKLIELTEGMLYYMGAATTGSFVLLGFFARGLFFETPGQPPR